MAEQVEVEASVKRELLEPSHSTPPHFLEVVCRSSGKVRRFAAGTEAGFALYVINRKLGYGVQPALHIEAVKDGEEPVNFGPKSVLVNYGEGWNLQTVPEKADYEEATVPPVKKSPPLMDAKKSPSLRDPANDLQIESLGKIQQQPIFNENSQTRKQLGLQLWVSSEYTETLTDEVDSVIPLECNGKSASVQPKGKTSSGLRSNISSVYLGKILLAFGFIFLLGGMFTLILENLPRPQTV